ncbi:hypothetical protein AB6A40_007301 [Gnathostoma spinigerum]|uniref:Uncharacterized protein n=1 Tax=Gnathostoma spinigerum TaxID=75299 RepID=A0ABD6EN08_9BILA
MDLFGFPHIYHGTSSTSNAKVRSFTKRKGQSFYFRDDSGCGVTTNKHSKRIHPARFEEILLPVKVKLTVCERRLIYDALESNVLLAVPSDVDTFFVSAVVMANFFRWYPTGKIVYLVGTNLDARRISERFIFHTGLFNTCDICVYGLRKKSDRFSDWLQNRVFFTTAEVLHSSLKENCAKDIKLLVIENAEKAVSGCNPVCELVKKVIFSGAHFRIIAHCKSSMNKLPALQSLVTNLQIGLIRSMKDIICDISYAFSTYRMKRLSVCVTSEMKVVAEQLEEALAKLSIFLFESHILPTSDLNKVLFHSSEYLLRLRSSGCLEYSDVFDGFRCLVESLDLLMYDGLTTFAIDLREKVEKNPNVRSIVDGNRILVDAYTNTNLSSEYKSHKIPDLIKLVEMSVSDINRPDLTIVVLCRNRGSHVNGLFRRKVEEELLERSIKINIMHYDGNQAQHLKTNYITKVGSAHIILFFCTMPLSYLPSTTVVDVLICFDEGLSCLRYTNCFSIHTEGYMYALTTEKWEENVRNTLMDENSRDLIDEKVMKGVRLCTDNDQMIPGSPPKCTEYWIFQATKGYLSPFERASYGKQLFIRQTISPSLCKTNRELLAISMEKALIWQDYPSRHGNYGRSRCTMKLAALLSNGSSNANAVLKRIQERKARKRKAVSRQQRTITEMFLKASSTAVSATSRICDKDFVNRISEAPNMVERQSQMKAIVENLFQCLRI